MDLSQPRLRVTAIFCLASFPHSLRLSHSWLQILWPIPTLSSHLLLALCTLALFWQPSSSRSILYLQIPRSQSAHTLLGRCNRSQHHSRNKTPLFEKSSQQGTRPKRIIRQLPGPCKVSIWRQHSDR